MKEVKFFVVEDHSLTNLGIRQFFSGKPEYICSGFASDKDEAIEKLEALSIKYSSPDILILDLNLVKDAETLLDTVNAVSLSFSASESVPEQSCNPANTTPISR